MQDEETWEQERFEEFVEEWKDFAEGAIPGVNAKGRIMYINYEEEDFLDEFVDENDETEVESDAMYVTRNGVIFDHAPGFILKKAPWANIVVEVHGGCLVFESESEYSVYLVAADDYPYEVPGPWIIGPDSNYAFFSPDLVPPHAMEKYWEEQKKSHLQLVVSNHSNIN